MPLKLYPPRSDKRGTPSFTIRGTYLGVHVNRSARSRDKRIANQALKQLEREIERGEFSEPGEQTFAGAVIDYVNAGGDRRFLQRLLEHFGDIPIRRIDQTAVDAAATELYPASCAATKNRQVYTPVSAILRRAGNAIGFHRPRGSGGDHRTAWLWPEECFRLFAEAEKIDAGFAALLVTLTYTGMRLSEALRLNWNDIRLEEGFAYAGKTKNDEPRAVFLPPVAVAALANIPRDTELARPFRFAKGGHLYSLLRVAAIRAGVELPERLAFHIFRHTYATWCRRFAGLDLQGLQRAGGWRDLKSVARYAHVVVTEEAKKAALLPTPFGNKRHGKRG